MKHISTLLFAALVSTWSALPAAAQGDDNCATAQIIAGPGVFPFDTTLATTDGVPDALCNFFSSTQIYNDVWWAWTAPSTGPWQFSTCAQTGLDTKGAVYDAVCGGPILACSDDSCGGPLQTTVLFQAVAGNVYLFRLGAFASTGTGSVGTGTITVQIPPPPPVEKTAVNPANGHTYLQMPGSSWTVAEANAVLLGGYLVTVGDQAEHDWIVANFHNYLGTDIDLWTGFNDAAVEGSFVWVSGQAVTFTNWDGGEPNNAGTGEDYCALRKNNPLAFWNDLADAPTGFHANPHGLVELETGGGTAFCAGDGSLIDHTTPCPCANDGAPGNGCGHSFDAGGANLTATGSTTSDDVQLASSLEPASSFTLFMQHDAPGDFVFHDGVLCAGGTLVRLRGRAAVGGAASFPNPLWDSSITLSQRGGVTPGSGARRYYAAWYRNASTTFCPPATANVTNGWLIDW